MLARCLGMEVPRGQPVVGRGRGRGGKAQMTSRGEGFYIPGPQTTRGSDSKTKDTEEKSKAKSKGLYVGAQEQETMRAFAEVVRRVLERDPKGTGEADGEGRGVKRKAEWEV